MGVLFFILNCVFATVILIMCFYASVLALTSKNPDNRYQPMRDDRGSFIKSQTNLGTTELDALGASARGDQYGNERKRSTIDDDDESFGTPSVYAQSNVNSSTHLGGGGYNHQQSSEFFSRQPPQQGFNGGGYQGGSPFRPAANQPPAHMQQGYRGQNNSSPAQANASPWQRGIGY